MNDRRIIISFVGVVLIASLLRFPDLRTNPVWYSDEAFYLSVSQDFIRGDLATYAVGGWTPVSPFSPTPPLFHQLVGTLTEWLGYDIVVSRALTATAGVLTVALLFVFGRSIAGLSAGVSASLAYALIPRIVANNRWGLPHTLAGLFVLLAAFGLLRFRQSGSRLGLTVGLAAATLALFTTFWALPLLLVIPILLRPRLRARGVLLGLLPGVPLLLMFVLSAIQPGSYFFPDLFQTLQWFTGSGGNLLLTILVPLNRFFSFITIEPLLALGLLGLVVGPKSTRLPLLLLFTAALILVLPSISAPVRGWFYNYLPAVPLLCLGIGLLTALLLAGGRRLFAKFAPKVARSLSILPVVFLLMIAGSQSAYGVVIGLTPLVTNVTFIQSQDASAATEVARYINANTSPGDFVIASNVINWQVRRDVNSADISWVACTLGRSQLPNLPDRRLRYDATPNAARFWIIDASFSGDVGICSFGKSAAWTAFNAGQWIPVFHAGPYIVYEHLSG